MLLVLGDGVTKALIKPNGSLVGYKTGKGKLSLIVFPRDLMNLVH